MEEITCDWIRLLQHLIKPRINFGDIDMHKSTQTQRSLALFFVIRHALLGQTLLLNPEMKKMGKTHINIKP